MGIELPSPHAPAGRYAPVRRVGDLAYVSGQGPLIEGDDTPVVGTVGGALTLEQGRHAAYLTGLNVLAALRGEFGSLDRVAGIVKLLGLVNAAPGFTRMPQVIDGCSALLQDVFGEHGRHARSAIGVAELPFDIAVEIELIAELRD
jgi:enamine deaminase RidA (YjgF/YER057c/UK114 family)